MIEEEFELENDGMNKHSLDSNNENSLSDLEDNLIEDHIFDDLKLDPLSSKELSRAFKNIRKEISEG